MRRVDKFPTLNDRQRRNFAAMYANDEEYRVADIAQRFGISISRVPDWAELLGLKKREPRIRGLLTRDQHRRLR